ncbi:MAG: SRPBCC family protein [Acidiferrobacter thiooxydans]
MDNTEYSDRIERSMAIQASRGRVWRALTNAEEFGRWFGVHLKGQAFVVGQQTRGQTIYPGYEHMKFDVVVERIEPMDLFSFRWHPYAVDPTVDYAQEQKTLVTFTLTDAPRNGTLLTVVECGFDHVPPHRRVEAFGMNSRAWEYQMNNIMQYIATYPGEHGRR